MLQKIRNVETLHEVPVIQLGKESLTIKYPIDLKGKTINGMVYLYRPSDKTLDQFITLAFDTLMMQQIPSVVLRKGKYVIKLDWTMNGKSYYFEKDIFFE